MGDIVLHPKQPIPEMAKMDKVCQKHNLNKEELLKDGISLEKVDMPMDTFLQLSGGDGNISMADVIDFVDSHGIEDDTAKILAKELTEAIRSLPYYLGPPNPLIINPEVKVQKGNDNTLYLSLEMGFKDDPKKFKRDLTRYLLTITESQDTDKNNKLDIFKEKSSFLPNTKEIAEAAGDDSQISMPELLLAIVKKNGTNYEAVKNIFDKYNIKE